MLSSLAPHAAPQVPAGQRMQAVAAVAASVALQVPFGHAEQVLDPSTLQVPFGHTVQVLLSPLGARLTKDER